jgi:glycosyltransferase involved in cell wall biosynthesis
MRILHLGSLYPPHVVGGAERVVEILAEGMASRGIDTAVAHLAPQPAPPSHRNGVGIYPLRHRNPLWIERSATYPGILRQFNKLATLFNFMTERDFDTLLREFCPDVVHTHSMVELTPFMWDAAKSRGATIVHTLHDYDLVCIRAALFKNGQNCNPAHTACSLFSQVKKRHHRHVDHVVGVSNSILKTHLERGFFQHLPHSSRHVVWNPVRGVSGTTHAGSTRREGPFTFGFLGRLVPEKGIDLLLSCCRDLPSEGWQLKVAGRAPTDRSALRECASGLPIEFVGYADPGEFLRCIDVLVVPSVWAEPFGLTVVEAYAAGVPVLGADSGGIAEIVSAVDPAWLVPRSDAAALTARMLALLTQGRQWPEKKPDFSAVLRRTDPGHAVDQYLQIYRAALREPSRLAEREVSLAG